MRDMTEHGAYGCTTYTRHFGSWSEGEASGLRRQRARGVGAAYECENSGDDAVPLPKIVCAVRQGTRLNPLLQHVQTFRTLERGDTNAC